MARQVIGAADGRGLAGHWAAGRQAGVPPRPPLLEPADDRKDDVAQKLSLAPDLPAQTVGGCRSVSRLS